MLSLRAEAACCVDPDKSGIDYTIIAAIGLLYWELIEHDVALLTRNEVIRNANLVRTIW
jgi:hypothetical protein